VWEMNLIENKRDIKIILRLKLSRLTKLLRIS